MTKRVYFARCGDYVKVGCSSNVTRRLRELGRPDASRGLAVPAGFAQHRVTLIADIPGDFEIEAQAAGQLFALGAHAEGEWFHLTPAVMSEIARMRNAWGAAA